MRVWLTILIAVAALNCGGAEQDYFSHFVGAAETNNPNLYSIRSPFLVDTNNAAPRVTNSIINLHELLSSRELSGIRLGMTMGEVIARWGKPLEIWSRCTFPYPTFHYTDVNLGFRGNSLDGIGLNVSNCRLEDGASAQPSMEECIRRLVVPKSRRESDIFCRLVYEVSGTTLTLDFYHGEMETVRLERPTPDAELKK